MDRNQVMSMTGKLSGVAKSFLKSKGMTTDSAIKQKHIATINESIKKNKLSKRKYVKRKLKKMKNMFKAASKVSPCLLTALAEQEKCIINEGNIPHARKIFDSVCSSNQIQKVIQNWNQEPENNYFLSETDPDYEAKKKKKDEYFTWFSSINGCGQNVHNNLLDASTLKDKRSMERYLKSQKNKPSQSPYESQSLNNNVDSDKYESKEEMTFGGRKNTFSKRYTKRTFKKVLKTKSKKRKTRKRKTRKRKTRKRKTRKRKIRKRI